MFAESELDIWRGNIIYEQLLNINELVAGLEGCKYGILPGQYRQVMVLKLRVVLIHLLSVQFNCVLVQPSIATRDVALAPSDLK